MRGGRPPTPLGQEKPVPCKEQVQRTGSWIESGRGGVEVTGSEKQGKRKSTGGLHNKTLIMLTYLLNSHAGRTKKDYSFGQ